MESLKKFYRRYLKSYAVSWKGHYPDWKTASEASHGYDQSMILDKVKKATLQVKNGEALYERDSVLFDEVQYSWPLLTALLWVAARQQGRLHVMDFGGSLGSSYFQNRQFLQSLSHVQWSVIEQPNFVQTGQQFIQDHQLQFFYSPEECIQQKGIPDILLVSGTLPYLESPYTTLQQLISLGIPHLVIDNTPFNPKKGNRLTVQYIKPAIYEASYPCWFLDYDQVKATIHSHYTVMSEHKNDVTVYLDGQPQHYRGLIAVLKK